MKTDAQLLWPDTAPLNNEASSAHIVLHQKEFWLYIYSPVFIFGPSSGLIFCAPKPEA